ncbi:MAG: GAF domain-containing protein [Anaerolineales bacterium]|nr:GAF domain-containing protein [Anaerolineales bacterium]
MLQKIRQFFAPPVFEDGNKTLTALFVNSLVWTFVVVGGIYAIIVPIFWHIYLPALIAGAVAAVSLVARMLMLHGQVRTSAIILMTIFIAAITASIVATNGMYGAAYFSLILSTAIAGVLLSTRGLYIVSGINILIGLFVFLFQDSLPEPLITQGSMAYFSSLVLYILLTAIFLGTLFRRLENLFEELRNARADLETKNDKIQRDAEELENIVEARTAELRATNEDNERRAKQFESIAVVAKATSQAQTLDELLPQIAETISQQFGYYHVGIFLLDANSEYAVLIAANSEGGQKMLARNHKLKVGQTGVVGYVAGTGFPRLALDTGSDAIYFNNPDLPDTRSELALPLLRKGREIIGVLDAQSVEANAFKQEDLHRLLTLADQVTIAIENARLFEEQQKTLRETQTVYNRNLQEGWAQFIRSQNIYGIRRRNMRSDLLSEPLDLPGVFEAVRSGGAYRRTEADGSSTLTIPINLRGQPVGVLNVKSAEGRSWNADEVDIMTAVSERAALFIENARLLEESRLLAEREHAISEISSKIGTGTQVADILQIAARELGAQIRDAQITVEIGGGE